MNMRNEYLPFEKCLTRLKHSFIREHFDGAIIDFQHPSIRDMLLSILQTELNVRRQYISLASPEGLSSLITGVPLFASSPKDKSHTLILHNEDELNLLCDRIKIVVAETITYPQLEKIISSTDILIPRKEMKKLIPGDLDLEEFSKTPCGRVLNSIFTAISSQEFYENKTAYTFANWITILRKFYELAPYVNPIPRLAYLKNLSNLCKDSDLYEAISFFNCLFLNEPLIFRQTFCTELDKQWNDLIFSRLGKCYEEGEDYEDSTYDSYEDELAAYEELSTKAEKLLEIANTYYSFSTFSKPQELSELEELIDHLNPPEEPPEEMEKEDTKYKKKIKGYEEYWTIERLFEDL